MEITVYSFDGYNVFVGFVVALSIRDHKEVSSMFRSWIH